MWRLRAGVLILVGALAVHHGRYAFATAEHEHELASAHSYPPWLACAAAILLFLAIVQLAGRCAQAADHNARELPRPQTLWLAGTATLLAIFGAQESLESVLSHGRLPDLADVLGAGGWSAVPLAIAIGAVIALLLRGAARVLRWAVARRRPTSRKRAVCTLGAARAAAGGGAVGPGAPPRGPRPTRAVLEHLK